MIRSLVVLALIGWIFLNALYLNFLCDSNFLKYFFVPFKDLLNIVVLSIVIRFFVENKNDSRAKKIFLEGVTRRIILALTDERMYIIHSKNDTAYAKITQRMVNNELDILSKCSSDFHFKAEVDYCKNEMDNYWKIVSERIEKIEELAALEAVLLNHITKITNRTEEIALKLYE